MSSGTFLLLMFFSSVDMGPEEIPQDPRWTVGACSSGRAGAVVGICHFHRRWGWGWLGLCSYKMLRQGMYSKNPGNGLWDEAVSFIPCHPSQPSEMREEGREYQAFTRRDWRARAGKQSGRDDAWIGKAPSADWRRKLGRSLRFLIGMVHASGSMPF